MEPELHLHQAPVCGVLVGCLPLKILPGLFADWAVLGVGVYRPSLQLSNKRLKETMFNALYFLC